MMKKTIFIIAMLAIGLNAQAQSITETAEGKVGIGTETPNAKLEVYHNSKRTVEVNPQNQLDVTGNSSLTIKEFVPSIEFHDSSTSSASAVTFTNNNKFYIGKKIGTSLSSSSLFNVDLNNGNVGIGTYNPSQKLDIIGGAKISHTSSGYLPSNVSGLFVENQGSDNAYYVFQIATTGGGKSLSVTNAGNVGIGTTTPDARLTIEGSNNSYPNNKALRVKINGESETYKDQVMIDGNINSPYGIAFGGLGHHRGGIYAENVGGTTSGRGNITLWARSGGNINLDAGSVGVGTTNTKGFKLGVNGKVAATEVKIATYANWSDFVFVKDYDLPSLTEVEKHINEKGHLQNIPSAEEVKKNGFFLGEMDAKLLQKIEELTLYTIQQEKQLKNQLKEIKELKTQNKKLLKLAKEIEIIKQKLK